jgi:hypothetical protein
MSAPAQRDRIEIWRHLYAKDSLLEAREAAKFLLSNQPLCSPLQRAVVCLIIIAYARPFTESRLTPSKKESLLPTNVVPAEFRSLHAELLNMRNRAIGHKDAVAFPSTLANRAVVRVRYTGIEMRATSIVDMTDSALQRTLELCGRLVAHCEVEIEKYVPHFSGIGRGRYYLSLAESPSEWLEKTE